MLACQEADMALLKFMKETEEDYVLAVITEKKGSAPGRERRPEGGLPAGHRSRYRGRRKRGIPGAAGGETGAGREKIPDGPGEPYRTGGSGPGHDLRGNHAGVAGVLSGRGERKGDADMKRQVDIREISDGKLYGAGDMVKADTGGCAGCSACCRGMGNS